MPSPSSTCPLSRLTGFSFPPNFLLVLTLSLIRFIRFNFSVIFSTFSLSLHRSNVGDFLRFFLVVFYFVLAFYIRLHYLMTSKNSNYPGRFSKRGRCDEAKEKDRIFSGFTYQVHALSLHKWFFIMFAEALGEFGIASGSQARVNVFRSHQASNSRRTGLQN